MTSDDTKNRSKLRGQENYIEWSKRFETLARIEKWGSFLNGKFVSEKSKSDDAFKWLINNISDDAMTAINAAASLEEN